MAKFAREHRLRERRLDKQARKDARRQAADDATRMSTAPPTPVDQARVIAQPPSEPDDAPAASN